jgi:predicted ATPase
VLFFLGEFALAQEHLEQVIALYDPEQHNPYAAGTISDTGVGCRGYAGWVLWFLGYPDQALQRAHEALALARKLSHAFALAEALHFVAQLHQVRRDVQWTRERAEESITLSTEQGFAQLVPTDTMLRGWALAMQGQEEEGIAQVRRGLAVCQAAGAEFAQPFFLAQLAEVCGKAGQIGEGLSRLSEALTLVNRTGERFYEAEIYRLTGEITLQSSVQSLESRVKEAEECFLKAIEIARKQQAKSLELRATMSLVRLRQHQAQDHAPRTTQHEARIKLNEAHRMLYEVYNWFTEGFDTLDLKEAKALLESLESGV